MKVNSLHFTTIESTNRWAMANSQTLDPSALTIVTADKQTAGYGRQGRPWISPAEKNLYATFCLYLPESATNYFFLTFVMALSVAEVLSEQGLKPEIKWPNDLLLNGKKSGGILCESKVNNSMRFMAIGVGLNVNMTQESLDKIGKPATSVSIEIGKQLPLEAIKKALTSHFISNYELFVQQGFTPFITPLRALMKIGRQVHFHQGNTIIEGILESFNADGSITLTLTDGRSQQFVTGEIFTPDKDYQSRGQG